MKRIKKLDNFQKVVLIVTVAIALIYAVIYIRTIERVGYKYNDTILVPEVVDGNTVYSGEIQGKQAQFIVSNNTTVVFNYGDKTYGPYTVIEDDTAIPKDDEMSGVMKGIEVREGNDIFFRGGVILYGTHNSFYNEDGTPANIVIFYTTSDGSEWDLNGNLIDRMKPTLSTIYELTHNPELTHKGLGIGWFFGALICIINVIAVLFPDELFRLRLAFEVKDVDKVQPSEWAIAARYIAWIVLPIIAVMTFNIGLQYI